MTKHSWAEACLENLMSRSVCFGIATALKTILGELPLFVAQPPSFGRPIGQEHDDQHRAEGGDQSFDDEEPPKTFQSALVVQMSYAVCYCASERASKCCVSDDNRNPERTFLNSIPEGGEENNRYNSQRCP